MNLRKHGVQMPSMMATAVEGFSPSGRMGARAGRAEAESPVGSVLIVLISSNAYISPPYSNARDCPSFRRRAMRGINMVTVYDVPEPSTTSLPSSSYSRRPRSSRRTPTSFPLSGPSMSRPAGTQRGAPHRTTGGTLGPPPS